MLIGISSKNKGVVLVGDLIIRQAMEEDIIRLLELYDELVITYSAIEQSQKRSHEDYLKSLAQINSMTGHNLLVIE